MKRLALVILLLATTAQATTLPELAVTKSAKYLYVREISGHNDHPMIAKWLAEIGLPPRQSWCLAFVRGMYQEAATALKTKNPLPKYGRVSMLWQYAQADELHYQTIHPDDIIAGTVKLKTGDIAIWQFGHGPNPNGHTGLIRHRITNVTAATREGNTGPGKGVVREGDGVYDRERAVTTMAGVIRVKG